jgi:hypothetical protein
MSIAAHRAKLIQERRERFIGYINDGLSVRSIAQREGFEEDYVKKLRHQIAAQEGLTINEGISDAVPFGFTKSGDRFRARMGDLVHEMLNKRGRHPMELARDFGLTQTQQRTAAETPFHHNWTMSQLERLAAHEGVSFTQFMLNKMRPAAFAPKEEIEAWNAMIRAAIIG